MSETETGSTGDGTAVESDAGTGTSGDGAAAPATPAKAGGREVEKTGAAAAMERAAARRAAADTPEPGEKDSTGAAGDTGAGGEQPAGAGADADAETEGDGGTAAAGAEGGDESTTGSTVSAPDDWPDDWKARFTALPNDDARGMFLDAYKDMHRQFTESTQSVARLRSEYEDLVKTVDEYGVEPAEAQRVLKLAADFEKSPREVLQQLAGTAGLEVFFERPLAEGEIPEFKDTKEMTEYIRQQTLDAVRRDREEADRKAQEERTRETHKERLRSELTAAREKHGEAFANVQTAVMERLVSPLSIEDAYDLVSLPNLRKQAEAGAQAKQELAAAKAELESLRKNATRPPAGVGGNGQDTGDDARLAPAERAVKRAAARKSAAANA